MGEDTVETKLKKMIVERLFMRIAPEDIEDGKSLVDDYGADSVSLLELVVGVEEAFGIRVDDEEFDIRNFRSVAALARFVRSKSGAEGK
jgi:acyl carrier protein